MNNAGTTRRGPAARFFWLTVLLVFGGACRAHWVPTAHPVSTPLNAVRALPDGLGWAAGDNGLVVATINGGTTWAPQPTPLTNRLISTDFATALVGWVSGELGDVAHTIDGGAHWVRQDIALDPLGIGPPDAITPIVAPDESHAWALARWADTTLLYHTKDDGSLWSTVPYSNHGYNSPNTVYGMAFASDTSGWLVASRIKGDSYVPVALRTEDGGAHWQAFDAPASPVDSASNPQWQVAMDSPTPTLVYLHIWDPARGIGNLYRLAQDTPSSAWTWSIWSWNARVRSVSFSDPSAGTLVGDSTWQTRDGFHTVRPIANPGASSLVADFASVGSGFAVGLDGTLYTWSPDLWGDANRDGAVNLVDACVIAAIAAGRPAEPGVSLPLLDVNGDGNVTMNDAAIALRMAGGLQR